jgi:imidazolonepropionase
MRLKSSAIFYLPKCLIKELLHYSVYCRLRLANMKQTLLINIKQLAGILPEATLVLKGADMKHVNTLDHAWLRIVNERIADFGEMKNVPQRDEDTHVIDVNGGMVIPAFADSHSHLVFAGTREDEFEMRLSGMSYEEIAAQGGGIINSAEKLTQATEDELLKAARYRLNELVSMGTGALEIKSGYGLTVENELKMLRVVRRLKEDTDVSIKATFLGLHAIPPAYSNKPDAYVDLMIEQALPVIAREQLADYVDVFCEKGYFSIEQTDRFLKAASQYGLKPKIHVNQFNAFGGIAMSVKNRAVSVDHLEIMHDADFEALAGSETIATLLPLCSLFIAIPYAPARALVDKNIAVALASDYNPGSAPSGNMQLVQSLACLQMKLTAMEAFNAATINGAAAMELAHELGSITHGKLANLLITKQLPSLGFMAYNFGHNHIEKVLLKGQVQQANHDNQ